MTSKPSRPPPPVPRPGHVKVVRATFPYTAQRADELTFEEGDILYIMDMSGGDWWKAKCGGKSGLIPCNYVEENAESIDNPLHEASKRGNLNFMKECLSNNVSVNGLDKAGSTALHWAAHGGHVDCATTLLAARCEINVQNKLGDTPLHSAAWKGHPQIVSMLLEQGAVTNLKNKDGKLASDLAKDAECASLLRPRVAGVRSSDYGEEDDSD